MQIVPLGFEHLRPVLDLGYRIFDTAAKPYTSWSLTTVAEHLDTRDSSCWVALEGDAVVGFVLGRPLRKRPLIRSGRLVGENRLPNI